ncbi:dol-P-Man:Man(7)GlcNAc(2)-PP-Dol alpha-1,6-mannosyltransferase isoform X2 [Prorops nasuta]
MYYLSRPLPNIMAMPLVLLALYGWLRQNHVIFIWSSAAAIIIFRTELAILLGLFLLYDVANFKLSISRLLRISIPAGIVFLLLTIIVDSILWQRLLWPEGEVFYFNTILNKSSEWGTSPFLWYFYSALPRGLALSYFLIPLGMLWDARVRALTVPAIAFILLFSFLPHKELRFIIYAFPLLNVGAAAACHRIWENRRKTSWHGIMSLIIIGHLATNAIFSMFLLCVAGSNYPGGLAITRLHRLEKDATVQVHVHIDVLTAQTGVSRFTQTNSSWIYSKDENLTIDDPEMLKFTHLLVEAKSKYSPNIKPYLKTHDIIDFVDGFYHIAFNYNVIPPIRIKTRPSIFIMKRKLDIKNSLQDAFHSKITSEMEYNQIKPDMLSDTLENMEPVFDDIVESLEEFGRPLNSVETDSTTEFQYDYSMEKENESNMMPLKENILSKNIPGPSNKNKQTWVDNEKSSDTPISQKSDKITLRAVTVNISNNNVLDASDNITTSSKETVNVVTDEPVLLEKFNDNNKDYQKEGNSIRESVKKIIQEKMVEAKMKKNIVQESKNKLNTIKRPIKIKKDTSDPVILVESENLKKQDVKLKQTILKDGKNEEPRQVNVRESIRNIIHQFKEFERDFTSEDFDSPNELYEDIVDNLHSEEMNLRVEGQKNNGIIFTDSFAQESKMLIDAKESLKEIIDQFKHLKSELTSEEDDILDDIAANYMNRPISETLMKFSEALKSLIQRRRSDKNVFPLSSPKLAPNNLLIEKNDVVETMVKAKEKRTEYTSKEQKTERLVLKSAENVISEDDTKKSINTQISSSQKYRNFVPKKALKSNISLKTENRMRK